jgi:hypothetical protein
MQWHLTAFKTAHHARTAARALAFVSAGGRLTHARAHASAHALLIGIRLLRRSYIRKIHDVFSSSFEFLVSSFEHSRTALHTRNLKLET